ncbi:hypothetical protein JCM8097_003478 [Rhodosporidiobolus ruineniae]
MTSHSGYPSHHTTGTAGGYSSATPGTHAYDSGATTGEKIASRVPGTRPYEERKAAEYGTGGPVSAATGSNAYSGGTGTSVGAGTTQSTTGTGGGGIASKIPGTRQYEATHPTSMTGTTGAGYGSTTGAGYGTTGTGVGAHSTTAGTGTTGGAGIASKIPGTKAHAATHSHHAEHAHNVASSSGLQPGAPGTTTTTTTTVVPKPSTGDKISGKIDVAIGKLTHNPSKVAVGEIKQTEGKAGLHQQGLADAGTGTTAGTGTGHTVHGAGAHTTGRY